MSAKAAHACLYLAITSMAALGICPVAGAEPDRQCQTQTRTVCIPGSRGSAPLPGGEGGAPLPGRQKPDPTLERPSWPGW
jgi:hypothetical protein